MRYDLIDVCREAQQRRRHAAFYDTDAARQPLDIDDIDAG